MAEQTITEQTTTEQTTTEGVTAEETIAGQTTARKIAFDEIAPVVPVRDLDAALERYHRLGFRVRPYAGGERYGFANRGRVSLHLTEWAGHDPARTASTVYIYVSDADALFAEWSAAGLEGRLVAPSDTPYGLREFVFVDPDGTLHRVGSPLPPR